VPVKRVSLVFGAHNHQPHGSRPQALEESYQRVYKPLLSVLNRHPDVGTVLHFSGSLLTWIKESHAEFFMLLDEMVKRRQVELLGGGFYEPILPLIPMGDRIGQVENLTTYLRANFGVRPRGCWIAEGIWEPTLPTSLANAGIEYTLLGEADFRAAGVREDALYHPHLTEDQGKTIIVFALSDALASMVAEADPEDAVKLLRSVATEEGERIVCFIDDGERWALDNDGRGPLQKGGWIERFLVLIEENREWISSVSPGRLIRSPLALERTYFPCTARPRSSLATPRPRRAAAPRAVGGFFRQALQRHPEASFMYARMLYTHLLVGQLRGDRSRKKAAKIELWKGQANDAYWSGSRGGIHAGHLRKAVYSALIEAEKIARDAQGFSPSIIGTDFDMDGAHEYLYRGTEINAYVHARGAALFELDWLETPLNYVDTFTARGDGSHEAGGPEDTSSRRCFMDHLFGKGTTLATFEAGKHNELGDLVDGRYECVNLDRDRLEILFRRQGRAAADKETRPLTVDKRYGFARSSLGVEYRITNASDDEIELWFAPELNLSLGWEGQDRARLYALRRSRREAIGAGRYEGEAVEEVLVEDRQNGAELRISAQGPFGLWCLPVETPSGQSPESAVYQCTCVVPQWRFTLPARAHWEQRLSLAIKSA
jgi:4-alpha-glucanotransferase